MQLAPIDDETETLANAVIGSAIEVHRTLGPGYLESIYEEAMSIELTTRRIPFSRQCPVAVKYKGHSLGEGRVDFIVGTRVVVELKAVVQFHDVHQAQVLSYLKATGLRLGLLLNFHSALLKDGIRRIIL